MNQTRQLGPLTFPFALLLAMAASELMTAMLGIPHAGFVVGQVRKPSGNPKQHQLLGATLSALVDSITARPSSAPRQPRE